MNPFVVPQSCRPEVPVASWGLSAGLLWGGGNPHGGMQASAGFWSLWLWGWGPISWLLAEGGVLWRLLPCPGRGMPASSDITKTTGVSSHSRPTTAPLPQPTGPMGFIRPT